MSIVKRRYYTRQVRIIRFSGVLIFIGTFIVDKIYSDLIFWTNKYSN